MSWARSRTARAELGQREDPRDGHDIPFLALLAILGQISAASAAHGPRSTEPFISPWRSGREERDRSGEVGRARERERLAG